jgi:hypothetical protein
MQRVLLVLVALVAILPVPAAGWSFEVHRFIVGRAIELLPEPIRPFYRLNRTFVVEHSIDPDLWRSAGFTEEPANHFLDLDAYGASPFPDLPRDYEQAVAKHGREKLVKFGLLPWRTAAMFDRLRQAFAGQRDGTSAYALTDIQFFSAVLAHYVSDGFVPFHAALNYDGQLTNQHGIHSRFEGELFDRYELTLSLDPGPLVPVNDMTAFMFDTLVTGFADVEPILAADRRAVEGRDTYDDRYFGLFFEGSRPILERRLSGAITAVASVVAAAWEQGGRPALPLETTRRVRPVRRQR